MKKITAFPILVVMISAYLLVCLSNCSKEEGPAPDAPPVSDTTYFSIEGVRFSNGYVDDLGITMVAVTGDFIAFKANTFTVEDHGHVISASNPSPAWEINDGFSSLGPRNNKGQFFSTISNLQPGTKYYARAYLKKRNIDSGVESYVYHNRSISFVTKPAEGPSLQVLDPANITNSSVTVLGQVADFKELPLTEHGFVWSTEIVEPTLSSNNGVANLGELALTASHTFTTVVEGLQPNTTYYIRAFGQNEFMSGYSENILEVTTLALPSAEIVVGAVNLVVDANNTGDVNPGESFDLSIQLKNLGDATAENVSAHFSSPMLEFFDDLPISYNSILPNSEKEQQLSLRMSNEASPGQLIPVNVNIQSNSRNWSYENAFTIEVFSPYVVNNGLLFYLPFDEDTPSAAEDRIGGLEGAVFGAEYVSDNIPGNDGSVLEFNAAEQDYVSFPINPILNQLNLSFSFWLKSTATSFTLFQASTNNSMGLGVGVDNGQVVVQNDYFSSFNYNFSSHLDNYWHHIVIVTNENGKAKLYVDGSLKSQRDNIFWDSNDVSQDGLFLGRNYFTSGTASDYFNGKLDNLRIYNRSLTASEVNQIFQARQ